MKVSRLTREHWTDLGLAILGREGPEGLTVEAMCTAANKTRGSLYHHFKDIDTLRAGVLERWRNKHTEALVEEVDRGGTGPSLSHINTLALALDFDVERNVRRLVARRPQLRHLVADADRRRIEYLAELHRRGGKMDELQAKTLAQIEYAAWIGFQYIEPHPSPDRLLELYGVFDVMTRSYCGPTESSDDPTTDSGEKRR